MILSLGKIRLCSPTGEIPTLFFPWHNFDIFFPGWDFDLILSLEKIHLDFSVKKIRLDLQLVKFRMFFSLEICRPDFFIGETTLRRLGGLFCTWAMWIFFICTWAMWKKSRLDFSWLGFRLIFHWRNSDFLLSLGEITFDPIFHWGNVDPTFLW